MQKILVLGASGMAGHMIYHYFSSLRRFELHNACFRTKIAENSILLNVYDTDAIKAILQKINPDYVINCVGILIKGSKESFENAIYINAYYPHLLAQLVHEHTSQGRLIHISTDCVFSGTKGYYLDTDIKDALDIYGMTKNLGEIIDERNLTIRTSIIGPELKERGEGLFNWIFIQQAQGHINGYEKALWSGVTTLELAKAMEQLIVYRINGLYQLSNGMKISKYALIQNIVQQFNLKIVLQKVEGIPIDKSIQPSSREGFSYVVPSYNAMIKELYDFMDNYKKRYTRYLG
jgi:dTDP-4-dehydrorhamnose reductase